MLFNAGISIEHRSMNAWNKWINVLCNRYDYYTDRALLVNEIEDK